MTPIARRFLRFVSLVVFLATGALATAAVKWHPGHYVMGVDSRIYTNAHFVGVKQRYHWGELEQARGVYDFGPIVEDLRTLERHGKYLVLDVSWQACNVWARNRLCAPQYIWDGGGVVAPSSDGCAAAIWRTWVGDRYRALLKALGERFDGETHVAGLVLGEETTLGMESDANRSNFPAALKANLSAAVAAFPNTWVVRKGTGLFGDQSLVDNFIEYAYRNRGGIAATDLKTWKLMPLQKRNPQYAGLMVLTVDNQRPSTSPSSTVEEAYDWAIVCPTGLCANVVFWSRNGSGEWDLNNIMAVVNKRNGHINAARPINIMDAGHAVRAGASEGDGEERLDTGAVDLSSSDLELVRDDDGPGAQLVGLRFAPVAIPPGSTIEGAWLTFRADETSSGTAALVIQGEASDNAARFAASAHNISGRSRTAAATTWSPASWSHVGLTHRTPDLAAVLREIVARPGWQCSNAVALVISGSGKRVAESYDGDAAGAPTLHVSFSAPAPPSAPYSVSAEARSASTIRLTWGESGPPAESFKIDRRQSGTGTWAHIATLPAGRTAYDDTGLPEGTKFYYKLKASNALGDSPYSAVANATTPLSPPAAPAGLTARAESSSGIVLSWQDRSGNEESFKLDRRRSGTTGWERIATLAPDTTGYSDTGLPAATRFYYKVKAWNTAGNSDYSAVADATTPDGVGEGTRWRYRKGTAEASDPPAAWRLPGFDDSGWSSGSAPFGYGVAPLGTTLADMRGNYSSVFLRSAFNIQQAALSSELRLRAQFDDGFILWINGREVSRVNMAGASGSVVRYDGRAAENGNGTWTASLTGGAMPDLRDGDNVIAVQVFNRSLSDSSDCLFDMALSVVPGPLSGDGDSDGDGLPDEWEKQRLGGTAAAPGEDPDRDGLSNLEEYVAGTDPDEAGSCFTVDARVSGGGVVVSFPAAAAAGAGYEGCTRHYALEYRTLADPMHWQPVSGYGDLAGNGQTVRYAVPATASGACRIYRARVWLQAP
ncbi:MAG: fibronectin type III domain-containing protein [Kiritimatiellae bacterium]|nr:fibronectin type III domain-containing protein [Kiritimatiellia bacterium]